MLKQKEIEVNQNFSSQLKNYLGDDARKQASEVAHGRGSLVETDQNCKQTFRFCRLSSFEKRIR